VRDELAENLLAKVMAWSDEEKARERALLQDLARYKFDEYQQYAPGRRFIESLALWLRQFHDPDERRIAYAFIRERLIFISTAEMRQLVDLTFPTVVRPVLIAKAASNNDLSPLRVKHIVASQDYQKALRQTLFLGLSDGARTDLFRRSNPEISNEQLWHAYDFSDEKAKSMAKKLRSDLTQTLGREPSEAEACFHTICLLDDFTASGTTYIRHDDVTGWEGKIPRILGWLIDEQSALFSIVAKADVKVLVCIYVASNQAFRHIKEHLARFTFGKGSVELRVIHQLSPDAMLDDNRDAGILRLAMDDCYFDPIADDEHSAVAGTSSRLGYAECRLPVVLSHNTPNNSIFLLRAEHAHRFRGLFPRVSRHKRAG
jgi:hypothetical protein